MTSRDQLIEKAKRAIRRGAPVCYDICAETGQMFDNVKHMRWFLEAVADELERLK